MSETNEGTTAGSPPNPLLQYVENFIEKRDNQIRAETGETPSPVRARRPPILIKAGDHDYEPEDLTTRVSSSTDIDVDEFNLDSDPIVETKEGPSQTYKQQVYLRQYQPPTPDPIDIQVQEVIIKPQVQRPPIHVHVGPRQNRDEQRTPSPILIKSAPPPQQQTPLSNEPLVFNKYVPIDYKPPPQQIIIHRHPDMPPKPRPIVVEQWLPNKPAPKRITYRQVNPDEFLRTETERQRNRFIEYTKPHTTIEVEIVRLPVIKLSPEEYRTRSIDLTRLDRVRSISQDPNTLQWRI